MYEVGKRNGREPADGTKKRRRMMKEKKLQEAIKAGMEFLSGTNHKNQGGEYWYSTTTNRWQKGDHDRLYVEMKYGRAGKWRRSAKLYIDLSTLEIHEGGGINPNAAERETLERMARVIVDILSQPEMDTADGPAEGQEPADGTEKTKEKKIVKVEKDGGKYAVVGQITGTVYFSGTRFDCCSNMSHAGYEAEERRLADYQNSDQYRSEEAEAIEKYAQEAYEEDQKILEKIAREGLG
jgi:hypothetical protein